MKNYRHQNHNDAKKNMVEVRAQHVENSIRIHSGEKHVASMSEHETGGFECGFKDLELVDVAEFDMSI